MKTFVMPFLIILILLSCESVNKNDLKHEKSQTIQIESNLLGDSLILTINEKDTIIAQRIFYDLPTFTMKIRNDTIKIKTFYKRQLWDSINEEWISGLSEFMLIEYVKQSNIFKEQIYYLDGFSDITKECIEWTLSEYHHRKSNNLQIDSLLSRRIACCALAGKGGRYCNSNSEKAYQILLMLAKDKSNSNIEIYNKSLDFYQKFSKGGFYNLNHYCSNNYMYICV